MTYFPVSTNGGGAQPSNRQLARFERAKQAGELEVLHYGLRSAVRTACFQIDEQATADAARFSLDEELNLLAYGSARAGNSQAAIELVARKINTLEYIGNRRLIRTFGG